VKTRGDFEKKKRRGQRGCLFFLSFCFESQLKLLLLFLFLFWFEKPKANQHNHSISQKKKYRSRICVDKKKIINYFTFTYDCYD